jgi:hypothetical protein
MKLIDKMGAQGDVLFRRVDKVPPGFKEQETKGRLVVAHSETGHHHDLDPTGVKLYAGDDPMRCYLQLVSVESCDVVHQRPWDTHETMRLGGGAGSVYEVIRQREYTPEGWRRVED